MDKVKVLIVEDEAIVALDIQRAIKKIGFEVTATAKTLEKVIGSIESNEPDIILMDINLGGEKDGIEITEEIKKKRNIPVIYLTAFSDDTTIQRAIATDPVGYLTKPFKREELKSNILLGLYKQNKISDVEINEEWVFLGDDYYFDQEHENLYYKSKPLQLGVKERKLLGILVGARGSIVPSEILEQHLWSEGGVSDSALRTLIYRLRAKLDYKLIETTKAFGCKLNFPNN